MVDNSLPIEMTLASYEDIALEYYDHARHPTCANFREASAILLRRWLRQVPHKDGWFGEVGAGKSLLVELLNAEGPSTAQLVIIDSSAAMLAYSRQWAGPNTHLVLGDSLMLPIANNSMRLVVSSLGDPYNVPAFWQEVCRVLQPGSTAFFTTPSYEWATAFRNGHCNLDAAEFELSKGEAVYVSSWILALPEQIHMIEKSGLQVKEHTRVFMSDLTLTPLSPKLCIGREPNADVVEGYMVLKPL